LSDATRPRSRVALGVVLWLAGMLGVIAFAFLPLPAQLTERSLRVPLWLIQVLGLAQSAVTLAAAVAIGTRLAPRVGLAAPAFEALVARTSVGRALLPQLLPGVVGGVLGCIVLRVFDRRAPAEIGAVVASGFDPSLAVRVLYGGITEELLLRWGVMTVLLWLLALPARVLRGREGPPGRVAAVLAILLSALVFGLGHLPTVVAFGGELTRGVVLYVVLGNALFGGVAGVLFWRRGLEAAMLAHALAHVFAAWL
jgi:membrane protease YdiL (CAAX protease family)